MVDVAKREDVPNEEALRQVSGDYKYGLVTEIESEFAPKGLNEDIVRFISAKKGEPEWLLEWRLKAYRHWLNMEEPGLGQARLSRRSTIQDAYYYAAPKSKEDRPKSLDEVDPELLETYEKLGIPLKEQEVLAGVERRGGCGVRFRLGGDDLQGEADEGRRHLLLDLRGGARASRSGARNISARSCPTRDNFYAALNSAVFSDGSFVYIPKGVRCPMELSHLFPHQRREHRPVRAHADRRRRGRLRQLPRRLHRAAARREPAPRRGGRAGRARRCRDQVFDRAELVSGRRGRQGRHLQFRHQARRLPRRATRRSPGPRSRPARRSPGNIRAASCEGDNSVGEFYSVADHQQLPAGRHRHQDDPYRQEHHARRSSPRASRPAAARTPIAAWCACSRAPRTRATTPSATRC